MTLPSPKSLLVYRAGRHFSHFDHFTINTGRRYLASREDAAEGALGIARAMVAGILDKAAGTHRLGRLEANPPAQFDIWVAISAQPRAGWAAFDLRLGPDAGRALALCTLAWSLQGFELAWPAVLRTAEAFGMDSAKIERPRALPWLGVQSFPTLSASEAQGLDLQWVAEIKRCLAWALLELAEGE